MVIGNEISEKMYVYDIVEYEKGIVYASNEEKARERVKEYYRNSGIDVDTPEHFDFYVWEYTRSENTNIVVIVNY